MNKYDFDKIGDDLQSYATGSLIGSTVFLVLTCIALGLSILW